MPNWVTNKIQAPSHVIRFMLNAEGRVDFNTAAPFPGPHNDWGGIFGDAETAAKLVCGIALNGDPQIAALEQSNRQRVEIKKLSYESFKQFVGMLENYRACDYLHGMAFARDVWGTKWNAFNSTADPDAGTCQFDTAWSCPMGVLVKVSERFPLDTIAVTYADEDIGSNCGTFTLNAGQIVSQDVAPPWRNLDEDGKAKWRAFACHVKGRRLEPEEK
jgi:Ferredoxin-like domain in Api92-like protein